MSGILTKFFFYLLIFQDLGAYLDLLINSTANEQHSGNGSSQKFGFSSFINTSITYNTSIKLTLTTSSSNHDSDDLNDINDAETIKEKEKINISLKPVQGKKTVIDEHLPTATKTKNSEKHTTKSTNTDTKGTRCKLQHTNVSDLSGEREEIAQSPFMPSAVLGEYESMRSPFIGAFLKFLGEQYEDIHDYPYREYDLREFCGDYFCTPWKIVCRNNFYEVRQYLNITAIKASSTGQEYTDKGLTPAVIRLLRYFMGENDRNITINMTTPIFIDPPTRSISDNKQEFMELLNGGHGPSVFLDVHPPYVVDTPKPTNPLVKIVRYNTPAAYVRMFGGYALPTTFVSKARELLNILELNKQIVTFNLSYVTYN
ncbi:unnamed protein product [Gordionus sp. m RMFG-2023]